MIIGHSHMAAASSSWTHHSSSSSAGRPPAVLPCHWSADAPPQPFIPGDLLRDTYPSQFSNSCTSWQLIHAGMLWGYKPTPPGIIMSNGKAEAHSLARGLAARMCSSLSSTAAAGTKSSEFDIYICFSGSTYYTTAPPAPLATSLLPDPVPGIGC